MVQRPRYVFCCKFFLQRCAPFLCRPLAEIHGLSDLHDLFVGIELVLDTRVVAADVKQKTLRTAAGETISYQTLIVATGARVSFNRNRSSLALQNSKGGL